LGVACLGIGLLGWLTGIAIGVEKNRSLDGFSLTPLYVLSFGLGGGAVALLRKNQLKWYESVVAWIVGSSIVVLGCGVVAFQSEPGKPIEWFWGVGSSLLVGILLVICLAGVRREKRT
jgi:peptidoglycan/LPS O-acetylase OafA/YrhL